MQITPRQYKMQESIAIISAVKLRFFFGMSLCVLGITLGSTPAFAAIAVGTCAQLQNMSSNLGAEYLITNDIDCTGTNFVPIGTSGTPFTGTFDGGGFTISHLTINRSSDNAGLFGYTQDATLQDVILANASVTSTHDYVGTLAGVAVTTNITQVAAVDTDVSGGQYVGGLIGLSDMSAISRTSTTGTISSADFYVGGLVGVLTGTLRDSYANMNISAVGAAGGLIGVIDNTGDTDISNSYAAGSVTGAEAGGFVGFGNAALTLCSITNSFAAASVNDDGTSGDFIGDNNGCHFTGNFYADNIGRCAGDHDPASDCTSVVTESLFYEITSDPINQWDLDSNWNASATFPVLAWQEVAPPSTDMCSLKAYWKMDTFDGVLIDAASNGYSGGVFSSGSPTLSRDVPTTGFINPYSLSFVASEQDAIAVGRPVEDDFTLCTWFKTTANGAGTGTDHFAARGLMHSEEPFTASDFGFGLDGNGKLVFGDGNGLSDYAVHGSTTVNTGNWVHACATRKRLSGRMKLYVNGVLDGTGMGSTTPLSDHSILVIGDGDDGGLYWDGLMDDVRVYDTVLNAEDIASLAHGSVSACFGEATPIPNESTASSSSVSDEPRQSSGGHRGNSTQVIQNALMSREENHPAATPQTDTHQSPLQIRTCARVSKWFQKDPFMIDRVNARLEKRLGFSCGR